MKQGDRATYKGYEVCLFPMDIVNVTQTYGPNTFSHCCGSPIDLVGRRDEYPIYAPFSCHLTSQSSDGNERTYTSNNMVWTPSGLTYVTVQFKHDYNPPTRTSFTQGDIIAHTGQAGLAFGDHVHLDQANIANSTMIPCGRTCGGGYIGYALRNSTAPSSIYYLTGTEVIRNTMGINFRTWEGHVGPGGKKLDTPGRVWWLRRLGEL